MKLFAAAFASVLLMSACVTSPQPPANASALSYRCESGQTIAASYPTADAATVQYKG